jgi:hypothetical protein
MRQPSIGHSLRRVILLMTALILPVKAATYYVDSVAGNDGYNGTSMATPWQTLTKVNTPTFQPGDQILFKANGEWSGQLTPKGKGTASSPIRIAMYGTGSRPLIAGGSLTGKGALYFYNQEYWEVSDLELTHDADVGGDRRGVQIVASNYGTVYHFVLRNLYIHNIKGLIGGTVEAKRTGGINIRCTGDTTVATRFHDILIENCVISTCDGSGISTEAAGSDYPGTTAWDKRKITSLIIRGNTINDISKNAMIIRMTDQSCLIEHNLCYDTAFRTGTGNTIFSTRARGTVFQYNEGYLNRTTDFDGCLYDADIESPGCIFQYSYSHDNNHGLFWEMYGNDDYDIIVRYNISQNDKGALIRLTSGAGDTQIYNNVFYIPSHLSPKIIWESTSTVTPARNFYYYNNIFYNLSPTATYVYGGNTHYNRFFSHNVFFGYHPSGEPSDPYKLTSDPKFVNPGMGGIGLDTVSGYKLQAGSPCIDSGLSIASNGGKDYWGNPVPYNNGSTDRGAHEYQPAGSDTTSPTPSPMTFATAPYAINCFSIAMVAQMATDASGVEYYFDCISGGGHDSGWQSSVSYTDTGLFAGTQYSYTVKARDLSVNHNETAASSPGSATTDSGGPPAAIFADGFEACFDNWTTNGVFCSGTAYEGLKSCKMDGTDSAEKAISTAGYSGITITYARNTSTLAAGDVFVSEWYDGTNWNTIESMSSGFGAWTLISDAVLPAGAANNPNFKIRFRAAAAATHYCYVDAVSVNGNPVCVFDTSAPAAPTGLTALGGYGRVSLDWNNNLETDLHHYKVYRNLTGNTTYAFIGNADVSLYEDGDVSDGTAYDYVVMAVDASGNESAPSEQANALTCMTVADFDCNGNVDVDDLSYMASVWLTMDAKADISPSDDEVVNLEDLSVFSQQWLK